MLKCRRCGREIPTTLVSLSGLCPECYAKLGGNTFGGNTFGGNKVVGVEPPGPPIDAREADPAGADPHQPGAKLDAGKVEAGLLADFGPGLMAVAQVCTFGAKKYTRHGWLSVPEAERRYMDAAWRHMLQAGDDKDSGLDHLAHAAWNLLAVLTLKAKTDAPR